MYFRIIVTAVEVAATNAAVHAEISFLELRDMVLPIIRSEFLKQVKVFMNSLNEVKKVVNEGALNFSPEEIEILKDGLGWILEYQEGVASDEYINAVKELEAKLG
jgi:hypothetical protein